MEYRNRLEDYLNKKTFESIKFEGKNITFVAIKYTKIGMEIELNVEKKKWNYNLN